jgi:hypothetical protein
MLWSRDALAAFFRKYWQDVVLLTGLLGLSVFVRWISLELIEDGGDPLDNWFFVRQWRYETDLAKTRIDHHAARMGIHWLTFLVQRAFGPEPWFYYVPTLIISNLCAVFTYLLGRQAAGKAVGVLAALLVISNGTLGEAANQLRRGIFECFYVLCALNCLVRYLDTEGRARRRWLVAGAVAMFMGYLTELSTLYAAPGVVYVMWRKHRNLRDIVLYAAILLGLFLCETAVYLLFTQYWNRLHVLFSFHLGRSTVVTRKFGYLFERFTKAEYPIKLAFYPFFVAAPLLLFWRRTPRYQAVILPTLAFLFLMTFLIRKLDPLMTFTSNHSRYLVAVVAPAFVGVCIGVVELARLGLDALAKLPVLAGQKLSPRATSLVLLAGAFCLMAYTGSKMWDRYKRRPDPFAQVRAYALLLNDTYERGLPIVARVTSRRRGLARARALHWVYKGFLRDDLLVKDGGLPTFFYSSVPQELSSREHFLARGKLAPERVKELRASGCALEVSDGSPVRIKPRVAKLPARCVP